MVDKSGGIPLLLRVNIDFIIVLHHIVIPGSSIGNGGTGAVSRQTIVARAILPGIASSSVVGNGDI